jgi:cell pole-organizing protein PopZ
MAMGDVNQEPSMEEILASIKRVIAEDAPPPAPLRPVRQGERDRAPDPMGSEAEESDEDVLELHDPVLDDSGLLSEDTAHASRQSLAALAAMSQSGAEPVRSTVPDGALEAVVRDMLRPMLKNWLDQRLPEMVEEMVSREIARITGKRL